MATPRIAIDVNSVLPYYTKGWTTGIGRTTKELVEHLSTQRDLPFDITLYSQNFKGITADVMQLPFRTRHLRYPHRNVWNRLLALTPIKEWATGYDLLHIPHNFDWVHDPSRTIITVHDTLYFAYPEEFLGHDFAQKHYPALARACRGILTCSESSKRDIMQYMDVAEEKICVTPWGYKEELFHPREYRKTGCPYFLMVSSDEGRKNTRTLIKAYEQFASKGSPSHELVLVWVHPPQDVVHYCNRPHLRDRIYIVSEVDDERLSRLYNEATATFFPSRYEGFGLPVLESMACGTPVVTCHNSSLSEVGGEAALYVDPDDVDDMAHHMEQFENQAYDMQFMSQACLRQAAKFSWHNCIEKTTAFYQQCLS